MDEVPDTRPSLLVRLCDPRDERLDRVLGDLFSADLPVSVPEGISRRGCRGPRSGGPARGRSGHGPLGPRPRQGAVSQLAVPGCAEHDAEPGRQPAPAPPGYRARRKSSGFSKPGLRRPPRTRHCSRSSTSVNSSGGPPNGFVASFGGTPGRLSGRPALRARSRKPSPNALGMSIGAVYMARSRVVARIRQVIERVECE